MDDAERAVRPHPERWLAAGVEDPSVSLMFRDPFTGLYALHFAPVEDEW